MAEIKWIKIATDIFDNRKIKQIESMPEADTLIVIWFKILCLAGNLNENGILIITKDIPYTDEMLATEFKKPLNTVRMALSVFERFGMIEINDNVLSVTNWQKYQNVEGMEKIREQNRLRQKRHYDRKKELAAPKENPNVRNNVIITQPNGTDIDIDKDIDKEKDIDIDIDYERIVNLYSSNCPPFTNIKSLTVTRKEAIKKRIIIDKYTYEDFENLFNMAAETPFLRGEGKDGWKANFDWLIRENNMAKVLEGTYAERKPAENPEEIKTNNPFLEMLREEGEI